MVYSTESVPGEKVATLDMGGTLVSNGEIGSTMAYYNRQLGMTEEQDKRLYRRHEDPETGDLKDHRAHARDVEALLDDDGLAESFVDATAELLEDRTVIDGAREFVDYLKDEDYTTVALSSAPPAVTVPFASRIGIDQVYCWKSFEFTGADGCTLYINPEGRRGKQQVVQRLREDGKRVFHFGNGSNDKKASKVAHGGVRQFWDQNPEQAFEWARKEVGKVES